MYLAPDGWTVTIDAVGFITRCILISPDYVLAAGAAWRAALRWHGCLLIDDGGGHTSYLSPDDVRARAAWTQHTGGEPPEPGS